MRPLPAKTDRSWRRGAGQVDPTRPRNDDASDALQAVDVGLARLVGSLRGPGDTFDAPATTPLAPAQPLARSAVERATQQLIEQVASNVVLLHHRRTPRTKPAIDHLVIAPSGVWIIHSRQDSGRIATRKPMFGNPRLTIGGHTRTDLLIDLQRQASYVSDVLCTDHPDVAVRSAICFVDTEFPLVPTLHLGSYLFFGTPAIVRHLNSDGPLGRKRVEVVADLVETRFPPA